MRSKSALFLVISEPGNLEFPPASRMTAVMITVQGDDLFELEVPSRRVVKWLTALRTRIIVDPEVAEIADDVAVWAGQDLAEAIRNRDADLALKNWTKFGD